LNGEMFLPFQWLRIREVDPRGSGSSSRRSMSLDREIVEHSRQLITKAGFQGIAMVEYKQNGKSQCPILMEINGRPWGSVQLAIASGIDYPRYLVDWCLKAELPPKEIAFNRKIVCRRAVGELSHLENLLRGKPQAWPTKYPNFWVSAAKLAIPWYPGMRYDDLSWDDPRPGIAGIKQWFRVRLGRRRKKSS